MNFNNGDENKLRRRIKLRFVLSKAFLYEISFASQRLCCCFLFKVLIQISKYFWFKTPRFILRNTTNRFNRAARNLCDSEF